MIVLRWVIILKILPVYFRKFEVKWDWAVTPQYFSENVWLQYKIFYFYIFLSLHVPGHDDWTDQIPIIKDVLSFCGCILSNSISSLTAPNHPCRSMSLVRSWKLVYRTVQFNPPINNLVTVEPWFDKSQYNKVLGTTNDFLQPVHNNSKMYWTEPRYNEPQFNEIIVIN